MRIQIEFITVGDRLRKDMGDIASLAKSIRKLGLLHPLVVDCNYTLICGGRRLEAVKSLGWKKVEVTLAKDLDDVKKAELAEVAENTERKDLLPSELPRRAKLLEPMEREAAKKRQREHGRTTHGKPKVTPEKFSEVTGKAKTKVAAALGVSAPTLAKATAVVEAAEREPERYGDLVTTMDQTKKVDPAYRELKQRQAEKPTNGTPKKKAEPEVSIDASFDRIVRALDREWETLGRASRGMLIMRLRAELVRRKNENDQ